MAPRPTRLCWALLALLLPLSNAAAAPAAERLAREERLLAGSAVPPQHDGRRWRWDDLPAIQRPPGCTPGGPAETLLARPRVDLFRCQAGFPNTLVGIGRDGRRWSRELRHRSGAHAVELGVGGASATAITLDTLEVVDPASGKSLKFAPMQLIDSPPRPMPLLRISGALACPADGGDCFGVLAEGASAGLLRITRAGRALVLEKPQTHSFAPVAVADIQIVGDRLLLAEEWLYRGPRWVRFAVVDAATGRRLFEERHGEDRIVSQPRIVLGPDGEVALHYRDATAGRQVMVRYRITP